MKKTNFWKLALALVVGLSLSTLVIAQNDEAPTPEVPWTPFIAPEAPPESLPESVGGGFEFTIPNVFVDGNVLTAAQLNQNFTALGNGIDSKLNRGGDNAFSTFTIDNNSINLRTAVNVDVLLDTNQSGTNYFSVRQDLATGSDPTHFRVATSGDGLIGRDFDVGRDLDAVRNVIAGNNVTVGNDITGDDIFLTSSTPFMRIQPDGTSTGNNANTIRLDVFGRTRTMSLQITGGSDIAEPFNIAASPTVTPIPGMVVAIDPNQAGELMVATEAYDTKVAGIISGAGGVNVGLMLNQEGAGLAGPDSLPVALTGKVHVWVDAAYGAIQAGDLLTTSATHGHAMKVSDHSIAQGSIIGKAMTSLDEGKGLVLVLVSLQ